jgi:glycosyltransferase involved in cell wall biosynthesis
VHFSAPLSGDAKWTAYGDADIFVLPSQNENFGNTAAESVAAGTPVIVTDRCGIAPLLADVAGVVVSHDEHALAQALATLLDDPGLLERLKKGCAAATRRLDWESPVREMESLFRKLAGLSNS